MIQVIKKYHLGSLEFDSGQYTPFNQIPTGYRKSPLKHVIKVYCMYIFLRGHHISAAKFGWRYLLQRVVGRWPSLHGPIMPLLIGQRGLCLLKGKWNRHFQKVRRPLLMNLIFYTPPYWPSVLRHSQKVRANIPKYWSFIAFTNDKKNRDELHNQSVQ